MLRRQDSEWFELCKKVPMTNRRRRLRGGMSPGAPKGNKGAWEHGAYSCRMLALLQLTGEARTEVF